MRVHRTPRRRPKRQRHQLQTVMSASQDRRRLIIITLIIITLIIIALITITLIVVTLAIITLIITLRLNCKLAIVMGIRG